MDPKMAKQLQELQKENSRLKKLVADQALDMLILKEAAAHTRACRRSTDLPRASPPDGGIRPADLGAGKGLGKKGLSGARTEPRYAASPSQEGRR